MRSIKRLALQSALSLVFTMATQNSCADGVVLTAGTPTVTTSDAILTNANTAAANQAAGKKTALIVMGVMATAAAASCPACAKRGTCNVCTGSLVGAAAAGLTAAQMAAAQKTSETQASDVASPAATSGTIDLADDASYSSAVKKAADAAKSADYKLANDLTSVTTPDGRTIATTSAGSGSKNGALTLGEKNALAAALKKAEDTVAKNASLIASVADDVGGGSAASNSKAKVLADSPAFAKANVRTPASVAGAFKNYKGDKIGVAADSVFEMMSRRYKHVSEEQNSLLENK